MPLKREILPLLDTRDEPTERAGVANTVLFANDGRQGFNTDVYGVTRALRESGVRSVASVHVLGAGATAASVIVAVSMLGARSVAISTRSPSKAVDLLALGKRLGTAVTIGMFDAAPRLEPDLVVSTLPGGTNPNLAFPLEVLTGATFFDVAYDPWPSELASRWLDVGGQVISGLEMLAYQALGQVRIFVNGSAEMPLENEDRVVEAMRASVGLGPELGLGHGHEASP